MDHYFIWICNGNTTCEGNSYAITCVNSLLASPENISLVHSCVPILRCAATYIAVLDTQSETTVKWIKTNSDISSHLPSSENIASPISTEDKDICGDAKKEKNSPCKEIENARDLDQFLSSHLHKLADELPVSGSFKLDVIIHQNVLNSLSVRKDHQFVLSLYRLYRWHSALTTFISSSSQDQSSLKEWCNIVDAEIVDSTYRASLGPLVWRGSLKLNNADVMYPGFQLRVDPLESEIKLCDNSSNSELTEISQENFILSPRLEVVHECDFYSIPSYLILPVAFRLYTCRSNMFNKKSKELLECLYCSNTGTSIIVRLHFTICYEKLKPDKSLSTNKWHKTFSTGKIKDPDNYPLMEKFLTLAITKSPKSGEVVAHPLRGPGELNARGFFPFSKWLQSKNARHSQDKDSANYILPLNLPSLSHHSFEALINKYNSFEETCCKNGHSSFDGSCCASAFLENITKTYSGGSLSLDLNKIQVIKEDLDPNDWLERVCLFQKHLEAENEKIKAPPNVLRNKNNNFTFTCNDVDKYFLPTGESKINAEGNESSVLNVTEFVLPPTQDFDAIWHIIKTRNWPEALALKYHDIYYYSSQTSEEKEATGNKMVQCYVQHETAVIRNDAQLNPNAPIVIRPKSQPSDQTQKYRSPATPRGISRLKQKLKDLSKVSSSQSFGTPILKRSLSNSSLPENKKEQKREVSRNIFPVRSSPRKRNAVNYSQTTSKGVPRHHSMESVGCGPMRLSKLRRTVSSTSVPYRSNGVHKSNRNPHSKRNETCSPRKKNSEDTSQSASGNSEKPKRNSDPKQLPEILRMKLRVAVVTALEQNGININDNLYQSCGKKLFAICQAFVQDIPQQKGSVSKLMQKIADSHVKQVIEFEKLKQ